MQKWVYTKIIQKIIFPHYLHAIPAEAGQLPARQCAARNQYDADVDASARMQEVGEVEQRDEKAGGGRGVGLRARAGG